MNITILTDNPNSWIIPYVNQLKDHLINLHFNVTHITNHGDIKKGDIMFILSCEKILPKEKLNFHEHNIVVHPSKLPEGKGWSPLAWQVLEGKNDIPITLFEATEEVDSGKIYLTDVIRLDGTELNDEIKHKQGEITLELILKYIDNLDISGYTREGKESFYRKFKKEDNRLDVTKTIEEQFNILRIVDNSRYPAFFELNGQEYIIKIYKNKVKKT